METYKNIKYTKMRKNMWKYKKTKEYEKTAKIKKKDKITNEYKEIVK